MNDIVEVNHLERRLGQAQREISLLRADNFALRKELEASELAWTAIDFGYNIFSTREDIVGYVNELARAYLSILSPESKRLRRARNIAKNFLDKGPTSGT